MTRKARTPKFTIWRNADGEWTWTLTAKNGEKIAHNEGYPRRSIAIRALAMLQRNVAEAELVIEE